MKRKYTKRRSREQIIGDILKFLSTEDKTQTDISETLGFNPITAAEYLSLLKWNRHVSIGSNRKIGITNKGRELLAAIKHVEEQLQ